MADMVSSGASDYAEDVYDRQCGRTTLNDTTKPSGLSEASNKGPSPQPVSFRITTSK